MPAKLREVAGHIDMQFDSMHSYINRKTGEILVVETRMIDLVENDEEYDNSAAGGEEAYEDAKRVLNSPDFLALPEKESGDEYRLMEDFIDEVEDENVRELLEMAIRGKGAFRRFKDVINRKGIAEAWYAKRDAALEGQAKEFLAANGISYE